MKSKINQEERAYKAWFELINTASLGKYITYKELGHKIGIHHRAVRYVLGLIQNYCMDNELPPLTILVINQDTGKPGDGFIAWDIENTEDGVKKVYNYNWKRMNNPFGFVEIGMTSEDIVNELINNPDSSAEIYARIKVRGTSQRLFRNALLRVYDYSCCICGLSFENALEACHIIPFSKADSYQRLDVSNGLLLCANHHKMFDSGQITINQDYSISYFDMNESEGGYSLYDRLMTIELNGELISLPNDNRLRPKKEYLLQHQETFLE